MDYIFYNIPNQPPNDDTDLPFDADMSLLEAMHYQAEQDLVHTNEQAAVVEGTPEQRALLKGHYDNLIVAAEQRLADAEKALLEARAAKQPEWDQYREEQVQAAAEEAGIEAPPTEVTK